jgi:hypothetical protein
MTDNLMLRYVIFGGSVIQGDQILIGIENSYLSRFSKNQYFMLHIHVDAWEID